MNMFEHQVKLLLFNSRIQRKLVYNPTFQVNVAVVSLIQGNGAVLRQNTLLHRTTEWSIRLHVCPCMDSCAGRLSFTAVSSWLLQLL